MDMDEWMDSYFYCIPFHLTSSVISTFQRFTLSFLSLFLSSHPIPAPDFLVSSPAFPVVSSSVVGNSAELLGLGTKISSIPRSGVFRGLQLTPDTISIQRRQYSAHQ